MNAGVYAKGDNYEVARHIRNRLPCPITGNVSAKFSKDSFIGMCLFHQKQSKIPAAVKKCPGRCRCKGCATGKLIADGGKFKKPDCVTWVD